MAHINVEGTDVFYYYGKNVPSMKNLFHFSTKTGRKYPDKRWKEYEGWLSPQLQADLRKFRSLIDPDRPVRLHVAFHRDSRRRADYINLMQGVADLMVSNGLLDDDDSTHLVPVFESMTLDRDNPGFAFYVEQGEIDEVTGRLLDGNV